MCRKAIMQSRYARRKCSFGCTYPKNRIFWYRPGILVPATRFLTGAFLSHEGKRIRSAVAGRCNTSCIWNATQPRTGNDDSQGKRGELVYRKDRCTDWNERRGQAQFRSFGTKRKWNESSSPHCKLRSPRFVQLGCEFRSRSPAVSLVAFQMCTLVDLE